MPMTTVFKQKDQTRKMPLGGPPPSTLDNRNCNVGLGVRGNCDHKGYHGLC